MPEIRNVFTDYNETFDPKCLEIDLGYALKDYYKQKDNEEKYREMRKKQFSLWWKLLKEGSDAVLDKFVDIVLVGEEREAFDEAMKAVSSGTDYIPAWLHIAGLISKDIGEKVSGEIDPEAIKFFEAAKKKGLTTGIYSGSSVDIIKPYLEALGIAELFDHVIANEIVWDGSKISGLNKKILRGKGGFDDDMIEIGLNPRETAYIDDCNIVPMLKAGVAIAAPSAKKKFKEECNGYNLTYERLGYDRRVYIPESWKEVGEILGVLRRII